MDESPVVRLTNAILLSAIKKSASAIIIRREAEQGIVEFVYGDRLETELEIGELHAPLIRRLVVMASIPTHRKGEYGYGRIELALGDDPAHAYFDITVRGHGQDLRAQIAVHGRSERAPPFTPPGVALDEGTR